MYTFNLVNSSVFCAGYGVDLYTVNDGDSARTDGNSGTAAGNSSAAARNSSPAARNSSTAANGRADIDAGGSDGNPRGATPSRGATHHAAGRDSTCPAHHAGIRRRRCRTDIPFCRAGWHRSLAFVFKLYNRPASKEPQSKVLTLARVRPTVGRHGNKHRPYSTKIKVLCDTLRRIGPFTPTIMGAFFAPSANIPKADSAS